MPPPSYTGHVEPNGPWLDWIDGPVRLRKLSVGDVDNNVYVISCVRSGAALIVDAADDAPRLRAACVDVAPLAVVQTHGHWDHIRAWDDLVADPGLPVWGHAGDRELFPHAPDRFLEDGAVLEVGDLSVEVIHTPGHTDGSLHYLVQGAEAAHLISGDSLFPGGPGRTTPETFPTLMNGLEEKVFGRLPDSTWIHPGHGDDTTVGRERPSLSVWRERGW